MMYLSGRYMGRDASGKPIFKIEWRKKHDYKNA